MYYGFKVCFQFQLVYRYVTAADGTRAMCARAAWQTEPECTRGCRAQAEATVLTRRKAIRFAPNG
jgi:hypothetical protein